MDSSPTSELFAFKDISKRLNASGSTTFSRPSEFSTPFSDITSTSSRYSSPTHGSPSPPSSKSNSITDSLLTNNISKRKTGHLQNSICCFCNEPLFNIFAGEQLVELECGHSLHLECFVELSTPAESYLSLRSDSHLESNSILASDKNTEIICPKCCITTSCSDKEVTQTLIKSQMFRFIDGLGIYEHKDEVLLTPTLDNLNEYNKATERSNHRYSIFSNEMDPLTPVAQTGGSFWERDSEIQKGCQDLMFEIEKNDFNRSLKTSSSSKFSSASSPTSNNHNVDLAKIIMAPEFSSIKKNSKPSGKENEMGVVINISTSEFEPSLEMNKEEQIKADIGKSKITNTIINNFKENLEEFKDDKIDISTIGRLILFDFTDSIIIRNVSYKSCQIFLFESNIIILNHEGTKVILNQDIAAEKFISSIFENGSKNSIIINLNSIKIPDITLVSENKILRYKWLRILNKILSQSEIYHLIPLIQISTNAWSLISDCTSAIPDDIRIYNKLISKGLDLPYGFLQRQLLRPEAIPMVLIIAIPLVNSEDYAMESNEFAEVIKNVLKLVLKSLNSDDKLGVVFLGNKKNNELLGNYYGCVGKSWKGWELLLDSISADSVSADKNYKDGDQWIEGLKYLEILSSRGFDSTSKNRKNYIHEIVYITSEVINLNSSNTMNNIIEEKDSEDNPFLVKKLKSQDTLFETIKSICNKYNVVFNSILLADEFKYEPIDLINHYEYLFQNDNLLHYENQINFQLVLDFNDLENSLKVLINKLHNITIRKLSTSILVPEGIELLGVERKGEIFPLVGHSNLITIELFNLPSGYEKSFMFKVNLSFNNNVDLESNKVFKAIITKSHTKLLGDNSDSEFENYAEIKVTNNDTSFGNNISLNLNIDHSDDDLIYRSSITDSDLNLSIVSRLSTVSDAYFIKRKIELLVQNCLKTEVLTVENFSSESKENAKLKLTLLIGEIWELVNSCNDSNTSNIRNKNIKNWSEVLNDELTNIVEGYSLRNYQLSNIKCLFKYLDMM